jgi:hypothetical protein
MPRFPHPFASAGSELELYYPVSPTRAAILSGHNIYRHGMTLEPLRMAYLNQTIEFIAYEQLFAKSEEPLIRTFVDHLVAFSQIPRPWHDAEPA